MYFNYLSVRYLNLGITLELSRNSYCLANFVSERNLLFCTAYDISINDHNQVFEKVDEKTMFSQTIENNS